MVKILDSLSIDYFIEQLKKNSLPPQNVLRFNIELIEIKINNEWKNLKDFPGLSTNDEFQIERLYYLNDFLLDTGNELEYCFLSADFLEGFMKIVSLDEDDFESKYRGTIRKIPIIDKVTRHELEFRFISNIRFRSKLGFAYTIAENWLYTLNINIWSIKQFFTVIIPEINNQITLYFRNL